MLRASWVVVSCLKYLTSPHHTTTRHQLCLHVVTLTPPLLAAGWLLLQMLYCNVEGVQFLDDVRIVISSDKAKKDQPYRCIEKEQRISIFALPEGAEATPPPGKQHLKDSQEEEQLKLAASVQAVE